MRRNDKLLSIVVSWRDRAELNGAIDRLVETARVVGGDVTIVNFGGSHEFLREQLGGWASQVSVLEVGQQQYFNKSCAQNIGAAHTSGTLLFFCDCDIVLEPASVEHLAEQLMTRPGTFGTLAGVRESQPNSRGGKHIVCFGYELVIKTAHHRQLRIVDNEEDANDGTRQAPGLLMVRRSDFLTINGYNSRLHGWGWEDQDMISRLTLGAGLERILHGHAVHLSHDDAARIGNYPIANRWESRDRMFRQALANYDNADFQGTYNLDVQQISARQLDLDAWPPNVS
ncbi:MAG: glycosyl transferase family 2 [Acidobacteria bacterium]|nr:glycosyl transferase family 2 [Acidobacteriota bacterium]